MNQNSGSEGKSRPLRAIAAAYRFVRGKLSLRAAVLLYILLALVAVKAVQPLPLKIAQEKVFDFYQSLKSRLERNYPVVIANIDEASLKAYGQWPWPRTRLAELVDSLRQAGAIVIGFDILFAEADRFSPPDLARAFPTLPKDARQQLLSMPSNDKVFADAMGKGRVVLGISALPHEGTPLTIEALSAAKIATLGGDASPFLLHYAGLIPLVSELAKASAGTGLVNVVPEADGIVRRAPALAEVDGHKFLSLPLEMLRVATGTPTTLVKLDQNGIQSVALAGAQIPTDRNGQFWLHFTRHDPKQFISIKDFLNGKLPASAVANKLVLVGTTAVGLHDQKTTPLDRTMAGVEIHAQLLESILSNALLSRPNYASGVELMVLVGVGLFLIVFVLRTGAIYGLIGGAAITAALVGLSWYLFAEKNLLIDLATPLSADFLLYVCIISEKYYSEEKSRRAIRSAFAQYISPELVNDLVKNPGQLVLGGESRNITIMFSDIRQFTKISESYAGDPKALTRLMNRFLSPLSDVILANAGTIDKYIGDAIMAFWNAPLDDPDHANHACLAALAMVKALSSLNKELEAEAKGSGRAFVPLRAGIGLNTGECLVGNLGSTQRFNYSALGDPVNLASRIEGLTKQYGVTVLLGESTAQFVPDLALLEIDLVRVVGKEIPARIYALLGDGSLKQEIGFRNFHRLFEAMLRHYRAGAWKEASDKLSAAELHQPKGFEFTMLIATYRDRIRQYGKSPPPADWDGVYQAAKK